MINQELTNFITKESLNKTRLKDIVDQYKTTKILIIGDIILDEFLLAKPERISREAPVLILEYLQSNFTLGGSGNAASNISNMKAQTELMGVLGDDEGSKKVKEISKEKNIKLNTVYDKSRSTTIKTRIISTSSSNPDNGTVLKQQVLRVDRQDKSNISKENRSELLEKIKSSVEACDLILLSDYKSGVLGEDLVTTVINLAAKKNKKVIVDSTGDFSKYKGAFILTPNQPDAEETLGYKIKSDEDLLKAGKELLDLIDSDQILITRGAKGMALFTRDANGLSLNHIPAFNLSEVFDVTGAGDTVAANLSLAIASGATALEAAILGNLAASIAVRKYGTATVDTEELINVIDEI